MTQTRSSNGCWWRVDRSSDCGLSSADSVKRRTCTQPWGHDLTSVGDLHPTLGPRPHLCVSTLGPQPHLCRGPEPNPGATTSPLRGEGQGGPAPNPGTILQNDHLHSPGRSSSGKIPRKRPSRCMKSSPGPDRGLGRMAEKRNIGATGEIGGYAQCLRRILSLDFLLRKSVSLQGRISRRCRSEVAEGCLLRRWVVV